MSQSCINCRFSRIHMDTLECHRHAPRPHLELVDYGLNWPLIDETDWCGEWEFNQEPITNQT
jgi:hypothetical protein